MINFIKEQLVISRLKKTLQNYARPDRTFLKSARAKFVTLAQQRAGVSTKEKHPLLWKYATVSLVVMFSMTGGMAVFADAGNVPATHPLYGFKRLSEQVRLDLSSPAQQVELHRLFAQRRLKEASEIKNNQENNQNNQQTNQEINPGANPQTNQETTPKINRINGSDNHDVQNRIDGLNKDFQSETDHGLDRAKDPQVRPEIRTQFCQDILNTINNHSESDQLPSQMVDHIKSRCGEAGKNQGD